MAGDGHRALAGPDYLRGGALLTVYVIPLKNGLWRTVRMTLARHKWWECAYREWWNRKGNRLAVSPEMWMK